MVQLSGPPLDAHLTAVARAPELLPVLPVGDFHPDPPWTLADLAVTGDGQRLWLVSRTTGRPVEPLLLNCVLPEPPAAAGSVPERDLDRVEQRRAPDSTGATPPACPTCPGVRRGRGVLHPARWIVDRYALPARTATWPQWRDAWQRHREQHRIPGEVLVGDDDVRHPPGPRRPHPSGGAPQPPRPAAACHITEAPGPAGWIDGRPAELLLTLTRTTPARPTASGGQARQHIPAPAPATPHGWRPGCTAEPMTSSPTSPTGSKTTCRRDGGFCGTPTPSRICGCGSPSGAATSSPRSPEHRPVGSAPGIRGDPAATTRYITYRPETRHGTGTTLAAAEAVFAADSQTALHRLTGDRQATTAASMITIADGFTGDGPRWLAEHVPHHSGPRLDPAQLNVARIPWHDQPLTAALTAYRRQAEPDGLDLDQVLADLLHLHHARMIGVDPASERHCLRLARTIARTHLRQTP